MTGSGALRGSVEDLHSCCESLLSVANTTPSERMHAGTDIPGMLLSAAQQEVALTGIVADGSAWGAAPPGALQPPQALLLQHFVQEAFAAGAVVLLALGRESLAQGTLQQQLEAAGVPCTCSTAVATELCADKAALVEQVCCGCTRGGGTVIVHCLREQPSCCWGCCQLCVRACVRACVCVSVTCPG